MTWFFVPEDVFTSLNQGIMTWQKVHATWADREREGDPNSSLLKKTIAIQYSERQPADERKLTISTSHF